MPVTNRRLKHAVVREKCPQTGSHSTHTHTHTDTHTINDQRSSEKRFASLARILTYSGPAGLGLGPFSCSQCKVGTKI